MIEQIPIGRVAERIEKAADGNRGMILKPEEAGPFAGLPGASQNVVRGARQGLSVRVSAAEVAAVMSPEIRAVAQLMRQEIWHRAATGQANAELVHLGRVSTLDAVQSLEGAGWKYAKTMPDIPHWYTGLPLWRGPLSYHLVMGVIRTRGIRKRWGPYFHPYLHANGWKYWVMATAYPPEVMPIPPEGGINRARDDEEETPFDVIAGRFPPLDAEPPGRHGAGSAR